MINAFENKVIKKESLPLSWREDSFIDDFSSFLQKNWEQRQILYFDSSPSSKQRFLEFPRKNVIKCTNYIGTIIYQGEQINIFPKVFARFDGDEEIDNGDFNLLITNLITWLSYCDKINFPFITAKTEFKNVDNLLELFIAVYAYYLKVALEEQPYYCYEDVVEESQLARGRIDIKDYATNKIGKGQGNILKCEYSKFAFDNLLNRIIKSTCKFLFSLTKSPVSKERLQMILMKLADVEDFKAMPFDCDKVRLNKLNRRYETINSMSKMFLLNRTSSSEIGIDESFCFLFPAELLFEGFVGGFIRDQFGTSAKVTLQASRHYTGKWMIGNEFIRPGMAVKEDIIFEKNGTTVVLDTKYKEIEKVESVTESDLGITQGDVNQMLTYAETNKTDKVVLLYPLYREQKNERTDVYLKVPCEGKEINLRIIKLPFIFDDSVQNITSLKSILNEILS